MVVVHVGVAGQHLAGAGVALVLVLGKFGGGGGAARRVNDDARQPLQPLHTFAHAAGSLLGGTAGQPGGAVVGAGFRLGGVGGQGSALVPAHTALQQQAGGVAVGGARAGQLVKNHQRAARRIIVDGVVRPRVGVPAPVYPVVKPVKGFQLGIRHRAQGQVGKHRRAAAHHLAAVFVAVGVGVDGFQMLGIRPKALAQPGAGQVAVGRMMHQLAVARLQGVAVCPTARHGGRVKALKGQAVSPAAQQALLDIAHLLGPVELVKLLEPTKPHRPKGQL